MNSRWTPVEVLLADWRITRKTAKRWSEGWIEGVHYIKVGRKMLVDIKEIDKWAQRQSAA